MKKLTILASLFLAVCLITKNASADCVKPEDYGAIVNDGLDDGPAFRAAFASENHVCAGTGVYDFNYFRGDEITLKSGQSLVGLGPSTVLKQDGDMHNGSSNVIGMQGGEISNLVIIQDISNPDNAAQNHLIQVEDSNNSSIHDVGLYSSSPGAGDCIRMVGVTNTIYQVHVNNVIGFCTRSGIGIQHGVVSGSVSNSVFNSKTDQALDYEPSSAGPTSLAWTGNILVCTSHTTCVTLSDTGAGNESIFSGNFVLNGNVQAVRANNVSFSNNTIIGDSINNSPVVDIIRDSQGFRFTNNYVFRPSGSPAGYVLRMTHNNGGIPADAIIEGNRLIQNTQAQALLLVSVQRSVVSHNVIHMGVSWPVGNAIACQSIAASCDGDIITGNIVYSPAGITRNAIELSGSAANSIGRVIVTNNFASGFTYGVVCEGAFVGPVRVDDNISGPVVCTGASLGTNL